MNKELLKIKIISYIKAAYQWHLNGSDKINDNGPGQQMIDLEEEILTSFGLPWMAQRYTDILQAEGLSVNNLKRRSEKLINKLIIEAESFLLGPMESNTEVLERAKKNLEWSVDILPLIGFTNTPYNSFIYYEYYFKDRISVARLLAILRLAELLDKSAETRIPYNYETLKSTNNFDWEINTELPFLKEFETFLKYTKSIQFWNYQTANPLFSEYCESIPMEEWDFGKYQIHNLIDLDLILPHEFKLHHFFIKQIQIKKQKTCKVLIITKRKETGWIEIEIGCTIAELHFILLHSRYNTYGITMFNLINNEIQTFGNESIFECKKIINMEIEIIKIDMSVQLIKDQWVIGGGDFPF